MKKRPGLAHLKKKKLNNNNKKKQIPSKPIKSALQTMALDPMSQAESQAQGQQLQAMQQQQQVTSKDMRILWGIRHWIDILRL